MAQDQSRLAREFAERVREATGQELDFSLDALVVLDDLLDEWLHLAEVYGGERPQDLTELAQPLAAYVGETIRLAFGGRWIERPGGPVLRLAEAVDLELLPLVQAILTRQYPPAFARLAAALERELEERAWK
ncbi:hypothetical protein NET03_11790 [Thermomicrobium sp. CFH 73360]|uniref:hypothetical protein n=1 Tax=Thermomicrobium sp. CFH 73360 TaxID=2951987 RepID=UPI002076EBEC|nr:hypothetical protein [Thermomicrobium sp. CFH 73360]MCM8747204.1 hypothetical protein [Thermomicrobium sp. CFH 73360]